MVVGGLAAIPFVGFETSTRNVDHIEKEVTSSAEGSEIPIEFAGSEAGTFEIELENPEKVAVHVQCIVEALDAAGSSVVEGEFEAVQPDGTSVDSTDYVTRQLMFPEDSVTLGADLNISDQVATYDANCSPIPLTPKQMSDLEKDGIPFEPTDA